jgi:hypothetical protein
VSGLLPERDLAGWVNSCPLPRIKTIARFHTYFCMMDWGFSHLDRKDITGAEAFWKEIILQLSCPRHFRMGPALNNGPAFIWQITQVTLESLEVKYHLHSAWRPQFSGKVTVLSKRWRKRWQLCGNYKVSLQNVVSLFSKFIITFSPLNKKTEG